MKYAQKVYPARIAIKNKYLTKFTSKQFCINFNIYFLHMRGEYELERKLYDRAVTILRAKPPTVNHIALLSEICKKSERVTIAMGSSNKLDDKNPFTAKESAEMLDLVLRKRFNNYRFVDIPDFDDDYIWGQYFLSEVGEFTHIISNNDWVDGILKKKQYVGDEKMFEFVKPLEVCPMKKMTYEGDKYISGTYVRTLMINDGNWKQYVPEEVVEYIEKNNLLERVKRLCAAYKRKS